MKHNPKETVNIIDLVTSYINKLNSECVIHKIPKVYEVLIVNAETEMNPALLEKGIVHIPKKCKRLKFTVSNTETHERMTLFSIDYVANHPADLIKAPYKRTLYRDFLLNAVQLFGINLETVIKHREEQERLKTAKTFAPANEYL